MSGIVFGRHEHAPCAGRETLHTQIYTSKIVSIILEEQNRRTENIKSENVSNRNTGSSGCSMKKSGIAAACVVSACKDEGTFSHTTRRKAIRIIRTSLLKLKIFIIVKTNLRSRYLWDPPLIPKRNKSNPNRGFRATGRGAGGDLTGISPVP